MLLFIVVPLIELSLLLVLADRISWPWTLALVIFTGVLGATLARRQGFQTWQRIQQQLSSGQMPADALQDALLIFLAGALLMTPGILTDAVGFSLLIPPARSAIKRRLVAWFRQRFQVQSNLYGAGPSPAGQDQIIDSYVVENRAPEPGSRD